MLQGGGGARACVSRACYSSSVEVDGSQGLQKAAGKRRARTRARGWTQGDLRMHSWSSSTGHRKCEKDRRGDGGTAAGGAGGDMGAGVLPGSGSGVVRKEHSRSILWVSAVQTARSGSPFCVWPASRDGRGNETHLRVHSIWSENMGESREVGSGTTYALYLFNLKLAMKKRPEFNLQSAISHVGDISLPVCHVPMFILRSIVLPLLPPPLRQWCSAIDSS